MNEDIELEDGLEPADITPPPIITAVEPPEDRITLTKAELSELVRTNVAEAMKSQAEPARPEPTGYDPTADSVNIIRQSTRMNSEALAMYSDLPEKYKDKIQDQLERIPADQISAFRQNGLHKTIARDIAMQAIEEGEYTPPKFKSKETPRIEPIGGGSGGPGLTQGGVPQGTAAEIKELYAFLGLPVPDDAKLRQAHKEPASRGS